mgnify:CR=1 FL=1|jgi:hypothetical protein|tara:strand:- start:205 stop:765 length:561 start_codon:yes stop_codon:yes gene_type:complete
MALSKIDIENMVTGELTTTNGGTGATSFTAGITMADQWRITSGFTGDADPISSNWERNDTDFAQIGTGLTESSGVFTFPSTGIYKIEFVHVGVTVSNNGSQYNEGKIRVTTDNSSYNSRAIASSLGIETNSTNGQFSSYCCCIVDVTNTSNVKFRVAVDKADNGTSTLAASDKQLTGFTVIRLGDT